MKYAHKYMEHGARGLVSHSFNQKYSESLKRKVVQEFLDTPISMVALARKYSIPSDSTVRNWISKYTKVEELKSYTPKPEVYTMKSRKTTHRERVAIVKDNLKSQRSYTDTPKKYQVNYTNIYNWVSKYKEHGSKGLIDSRGRRKPDAIQTEEEKLKAKIAASRNAMTT